MVIIKGNNFFKDKYLCLLSALINKNIRIYPDNIELEDIIKNNNKKRGFRNSISNDKLDEKYYLSYLHTKEECKEKRNNLRGNNRCLKKNLNVRGPHRIITANNVVDLVYNIHKNSLHQGKIKIMLAMKNLKIFYYGIYEDLENIRHIYPICSQKNIIFYKRVPTKQIIFNKPKDKYVMDLTYLPLDLCKNPKLNFYLIL